MTVVFIYLLHFLILLMGLSIQAYSIRWDQTIVGLGCAHSFFSEVRSAQGREPVAHYHCQQHHHHHLL